MRERREGERGGGSCQFERPQCPLVSLHSGYVNERGAFPEEACLHTNEDVTDLRAVTCRVEGKRRKEDEEDERGSSYKMKGTEKVKGF